MGKIMNKNIKNLLILCALAFLIFAFSDNPPISISEEKYEDKKGGSSREQDSGFIEGKFLPAAIIKTSTSTESEIKKSTFKAPEIIKAIYLTSWSAATPSMVDYAIDLAKNTEINAVVIDIKDWSGYVNYDTQVPEVEKYNAERVLIRDVGALIEKFHEEGIYTIARITVFQDPILAWARPDLAVRRKSDESLLWLDKSGLAWLDPAAKEAWDYNIAIAQDALNQGFDELNFDYVRFPSDGDLEDLSFSLWDSTSTTKIATIKEFYAYLRENIPDAILSVDLFGLSTVSSSFGVGQNIENAYDYFDFVCPMVYPSHYVSMYLGYENPAEYPYEIVKHSMESALARLKVFNEAFSTESKLRPWLQDFDLGAEYDKDMVRLEINAVSDALEEDFSGFMLWSADNFYTKEALSTTTQNLLR